MTQNKKSESQTDLKFKEAKKKWMCVKKEIVLICSDTLLLSVMWVFLEFFRKSAKRTRILHEWIVWLGSKWLLELNEKGNQFAALHNEQI